MATAYYLKFVDGHHGSKNRIGGQPTCAPETKPWPPEDNGYFAFVAEFDVDGEAIAISTIQKIQLFQPIDEGDDPTPVVGLVRKSINNESPAFDVPEHPLAKPKDILLEQHIDPDSMPNLDVDLEIGRLFKSKFSGVDPWRESGPGKLFIGQIREFESGLSFGGLTCCLYYLENEDRVIAELR